MLALFFTMVAMAQDPVATPPELAPWVEWVRDRHPELRCPVVEGQAALHAPFGGVVPEIAARAHAEKLDGCVERALAEAGLAAKVAEVSEDKKRGLVAKLVRTGPVDDAEVARLMGEFAGPWEWADRA